MELKRLTGCRMFPPISWQPMQAFSNSLAPLEKGCAKDTAATKSKASFKLEVSGERVKGYYCNNCSSRRALIKESRRNCSPGVETRLGADKVRIAAMRGDVSHSPILKVLLL